LTTNVVLKGQQLMSAKKVAAKVISVESANRGLKEMVSRNASKSFTNFGRICHCPREQLSRKCSVNRCKITYFCVIIQF
jgi:hypothetical protein